MKLSACVIVKDRHTHLKRCLSGIREYADEIIITDAWGGAAEIAEPFGAEVRPYEWTGDITGVRNASMAHTTGDWLFLMNADEFLRPGDGLRLRAACENAIKTPDVSALYVELIRFDAEGLDGDGYTVREPAPPDSDHKSLGMTMRLFRRDAGLTYRHPIFEMPFEPEGHIPHALAAPLVALCRDLPFENQDTMDFSTRRIEEYPEHPTAYLLRGLQYKHLGRPLRMLQDFEHAFDLRYKYPTARDGDLPPLDDRYPAALYDCGVVWAALGDYRRAIDRFTSAIHAQGTAFCAGFDFQNTLRRLAANTESLPDKDAIAVLAQFATDLNALARLVNILRVERPDNVFVHFCEQWYNQTHQRDINYITVQIITGEYAAAVSALLSKYRSGKQDTYAYRALVAALLANKPGMVESAGHKAVNSLLLAYAGRREVEPYGDAYIEVAGLLMNVMPDALATMRWMEMGMDSPVLAERLGGMLYQNRRFRRAIRCFKRAQLLVGGTRPDLQEKLAYCSFRAGAYQDAADLIEAAIQSGADARRLELLAYYTAKAMPEGGTRRRLMLLVPDEGQHAEKEDVK